MRTIGEGGGGRPLEDSEGSGMEKEGEGEIDKDKFYIEIASGGDALIGHRVWRVAGRRGGSRRNVRV